MAERVRHGARPRGVVRLLPLLLLAALLTGCGSDDRSFAKGAEPDETRACLDAVGPRRLGRVDVDGDGRPEDVDFQKGATVPGDDCFASDFVSVGDGFLDFDDELPVRPRDVRAVTLPGRAGKLVLLVQHHPRGGFVAYLGAFDGTGLSGVPQDGTPLVPFVATDAPTRLVTAACTPAGFEVTEAVAAGGPGGGWNLTRTPYLRQGLRIVRGETDDLADGVDDAALRAYPGLRAQTLFAGCGGS